MKLRAPNVPPEAYTGIVGRVVDVFGEHTEAAPIAIATQFLVAFGSAVGPGPYQYVGETRHGLAEYLLIVGRSARARKGDSLNVALRLLREADAGWAESRIASGMSSGEGIIHAVRDAVTKTTENGEVQVEDEGVTDKRLLVTETEFSGALKQFSRQGNTLSNVLREAWDSPRTLRTLTRNTGLKATGAHLSVIGHSTREDLLEHLGQLEIANGLGNRFLYVFAERSKLLPVPGRADDAEVDQLVGDVRRALLHARGRERLTWDRSGEALWRAEYAKLSSDVPGLLGSLLARAEAHVLRLTALYTLLTGAPYLNADALSSALALWSYCAASVRLLFGDRTGSKAADRILEMLPRGERITQTEIANRFFSKHISGADLEDALELLAELGEVEVAKEETAGRPKTWVTRSP